MSISNQLLLFLDIVQQGSFNKAATLHNMDNSSLSKKIKSLETHLGIQLLNRSTRAFSLTSAGEDIFEQAQVLKTTLENIQSIADSYQSVPKGILRITSSIFFGQQYLQPVISKFMKQYPQVKISLFLEDKKSDIISEHFDLAFRVGRLKDSNLIAKKIAKTNFALIASDDFIKQHGLPTSPQALIMLPAVIYSNGETCLDQFCMSEAAHGKKLQMFKMKGNYRVSDVRTLIDAVKDGLGYTLIDLFNLERPINELKLQPLLTDHVISTMETGIYAIYPHRKQTLLMSEFIKAVQNYIGTPPFWEKHIPDYKNMYK